METIVVEGGQTLHGTICVPPAKNSVLPLMAATLLCGGHCTLRQVPRLQDVDTSLALQAAIGGEAIWQGDNILTRPVQNLCGRIPSAMASAMRAAVFYLAPLLHRCGSVRLPLPGGCRLGPRPVDIHLAGLVAMGAAVELEPDAVVLRRSGPLHGTDFTLRLPSVGATETLMMAACCAQGTTVLRGAACEPEVEDLANFLQCCGAHIKGAGSPVLVIHGGRMLSGAEYRPVPDRIVASTYAAAAACAGGWVKITGCCPAHWMPFLEFLRNTGCGVKADHTTVEIERPPTRTLMGGQQLYACGYPGFATDAAPLAAAVMLTAQGYGEICDGLFENRFACADAFAAMGAKTEREGRSIKIAGGNALHGSEVYAPDLRGGAAIVLAALAAKGETVIHNAGYIRRGYARLAADLFCLGAKAVAQ